MQLNVQYIHRPYWYIIFWIDGTPVLPYSSTERVFFQSVLVMFMCVQTFSKAFYQLKIAMYGMYSASSGIVA